MTIIERLTLEIAKEESCLEDLYAALRIHKSKGDLKAEAECGQRIKQVASNIERLKTQLRDNQKFEWVINDLRQRGLGKVADKIVQNV